MPCRPAMRLFTAVLACVLCAVLDGQQRAALFSAVQSAGRTQCSPLPPLVTLRARSRLDCSDQCAQRQDEGCVAFNFKQGSPNCELFKELTCNNTEVLGCSLYQVRVDGIVALGDHSEPTPPPDSGLGPSAVCLVRAGADREQSPPDGRGRSTPSMATSKSVILEVEGFYKAI